MKVIDFLLCTVVVIVVLHCAGVDLSTVLSDVIAIVTFPSVPQFGDGMWLEDVMNAACKVASGG